MLSLNQSYVKFCLSFCCLSGYFCQTCILCLLLPPFFMFVVRFLNRRNPAVMRAVPAVHAWHPLPNESGGRGPRSQALVTRPRPLRQRARGSAGAFPPTAPGQLFSWVFSDSACNLHILFSHYCLYIFCVV